MAIQDNSRIETTPVTISNPAGVINANWQQVEKILDPDSTVHAYDGTAADVGNLIRDNVFRDAALALTDDGSVDIDFTAEAMQTLSLTQNTTFTFSNVAAGKFVFVQLTADSTARNLTWPVAMVPISHRSEQISASSTAVAKLWCIDGTNVMLEYHEDVGSSAGGVQEYGIISVESNATATTISATSTDFTNKVQFVGFDTNGASSSNITPDHTNDHITADLTGVYHILFNACFTTASANQVVSVALFRNNGASQLGTRFTQKTGSIGDEGSATLSTIVSLAAGDTVEVWMQNETSTANITIEDANLTLHSV